MIGELRIARDQVKEDRKLYAQLLELGRPTEPLEPRLLQWQRLMEETRHQEREQIVTDIEKRWQQQMGEWQFLRDDWTKRLAANGERVAKLEDWRPEVMTAVHDMIERFEKERRDRVAMAIEITRTMNEAERIRTSSQTAKLFDELLVRARRRQGIWQSQAQGCEVECDPVRVVGTAGHVDPRQVYLGQGAYRD